MRGGESQTSLVVGLVGGSHFVNHAYFMLLPPLFVPLSAELGLTDPQLGLALGTVGFVVTALQLPFGHLSDVYGRTPLLALSLSVGSLGALLVATAQSYAWLVAAAAVMGVGIAGHHPAHYPLVAAATTDANRGRAYSVHGFSGALGYAVPPAAVALASIAGLGWRWAVAAIAALGATYGAGALVLFRRRVDREITHPKPGTGETVSRNGERSVDGRSLVARVSAGAARFRAAAGELFGQPAIVALTVLWFATSVAAWGIKQYAGTLLATGYRVGANEANLAVAAMLAVGAVLVFAGGWLTDRHSATHVLVGGYTALVAVAGLLAWQGLPVVAALGLVLLLSATVDASRPARAALADRFSTRDTVGKNFGLLTIGISGGAAAAPPVLGVVVAAAGVGAAFYAIAAVGVLALGLTALVVSVGSERVRGSPRPGD